MNSKPVPSHAYQPGFTLVEMAIVLAIVGLLLGGLIPTLSAQMELRLINETRKQLGEIQQALIGYAVINGRLPCPAYSTGAEDPVGGGNCNHSYDGFIPAATLGLPTTNSNGFAVDSWGNRIRYAVTPWSSNAYTTTNGMATTGISNLSPAGTPYLQICSTASSSSSSCSVANSALASSPGIPVVIYSTGKNGGYGGTGADEAENPNPNSADNDRVFVSHTPTSNFDDLVIWISTNTLLNRMVTAGKLP